MGAENPYHATTATPRIPQIQLKTRATIPRGVNLQGVSVRQPHEAKGIEGLTQQAEPWQVYSRQ